MRRRRFRQQPSSIRLRGRDVLSDCEINSEFFISPINTQQVHLNIKDSTSNKQSVLDSPILSPKEYIISPSRVQSSQQFFCFSNLAKKFDEDMKEKKMQKKGTEELLDFVPCSSHANLSGASQSKVQLSRAKMSFFIQTSFHMSHANDEVIS